MALLPVPQIVTVQLDDDSQATVAPRLHRLARFVLPTTR